MSPTSVEQLISSINQRHATSWVLVGRLAGGYQQGAYELSDPGNTRAVLKWHQRHLPAGQLEETARVIDDARRRGWPTARWIAFGPLPNEGAYVVEEFIAGERPTRLTNDIAARLLDAIRLQAGAKPVTRQDWSTYIYRCVFHGEADLANRMRARPDTAALQRRLETLTASARGVRLSTDDLVHGDFVLSNMLVRDKTPYLIDAAHAGKGTRAYDLATLLFESSVGGDHAAPSVETQRRLEHEAVECAGREGFLICLACRVMHLLVFGGVNWADDVGPTVRSCHHFLDGLDSVRVAS